MFFSVVGVLRREVVFFAGIGVLFGHRWGLYLFSGRFSGSLVSPSGGSGGDNRECGCLEEDVCVDDCVGEGVQVGDSVEITLVGDVPSVVLKDGEGSFGHGASFVGVLEVGGGAREFEAVVIVKIDDAGTSVGVSVAVGTGLCLSFVGTCPLFSAIAFFLVEPASSGFHFQACGAKEFSLFGVGVCEGVVSSGVEGDVSFSALLGDVSIDEPCVEGGIS